MKNYIMFQNDGELDLDAMLLMGASTKRDDPTKIGFFGSGFKYAMAVALRLDIEFLVFAGMRPVLIGKKKKMIRDKEFEIVTVDGKDTNFTTDMGPEWNDWFIIREVYCNALDEPNTLVQTEVDTPEADEGRTRVYVEITESMKSVMKDWKEFFGLDREDCIYQNDQVHIYPKMHPDRSIIYRKGIKVAESEKEGCYDYDFTGLSINESRVVKSWSDVMVQLKIMMCSHLTDSTIMRTIIDNMSRTWEGSMYFWWNERITNKEVWTEAFHNRLVVPQEFAGHFKEMVQGQEHINLPANLAKQIASNIPDITVLGFQLDADQIMIPVRRTPRFRYMIDEALRKLKQVDIEITFPIEVCDFKANAVMGLAKNGVIYLSPKLEEMGSRAITLVLIEESEHIITGHSDYSQEFQTHLFNKYLDALERLYSIFF